LQIKKITSHRINVSLLFFLLLKMRDLPAKVWVYPVRFTEENIIKVFREK